MLLNEPNKLIQFSPLFETIQLSPKLFPIEKKCQSGLNKTQTNYHQTSKIFVERRKENNGKEKCLLFHYWTSWRSSTHHASFFSFSLLLLALLSLFCFCCLCCCCLCCLEGGCSVSLSERWSSTHHGVIVALLPTGKINSQAFTFFYHTQIDRRLGFISQLSPPQITSHLPHH